MKEKTNALGSTLDVHNYEQKTTLGKPVTRLRRLHESSEQSVGLAKTNKGTDTSPVHRTTGTPRGQQVPEVAQTICKASGGGGDRPRRQA